MSPVSFARLVGDNLKRRVSTTRSPIGPPVFMATTNAINEGVEKQARCRPLCSSAAAYGKLAGVAKGELCSPFATPASLSRRRNPFFNTLINKTQLSGTSSMSSNPTASMITSGPTVINAYWPSLPPDRFSARPT